MFNLIHLTAIFATVTASPCSSSDMGIIGPVDTFTDTFVSCGARTRTTDKLLQCMKDDYPNFDSISESCKSCAVGILVSIESPCQHYCVQNFQSSLCDDCKSTFEDDFELTCETGGVFSQGIVVAIMVPLALMFM
jgi:hypothetical protein